MNLFKYIDADAILDSVTMSECAIEITATKLLRFLFSFMLIRWFCRIGSSVILINDLNSNQFRMNEFGIFICDYTTHSSPCRPVASPVLADPQQHVPHFRDYLYPTLHLKWLRLVRKMLVRCLYRPWQMSP